MKFLLKERKGALIFLILVVMLFSNILVAREISYTEVDNINKREFSNTVNVEDKTFYWVLVSPYIEYLENTYNYSYNVSLIVNDKFASKTIYSNKLFKNPRSFNFPVAELRFEIILNKENFENFKIFVKKEEGSNELISKIESEDLKKLESQIHFKELKINREVNYFEKLLFSYIWSFKFLYSSGQKVDLNIPLCKQYYNENTIKNLTEAVNKFLSKYGLNDIFNFKLLISDEDGCYNSISDFFDIFGSTNYEFKITMKIPFIILSKEIYYGMNEDNFSKFVQIMRNNNINLRLLSDESPMDEEQQVKGYIAYFYQSPVIVITNNSKNELKIYKISKQLYLDGYKNEVNIILDYPVLYLSEKYLLDENVLKDAISLLNEFFSNNYLLNEQIEKIISKYSFNFNVVRETIDEIQLVNSEQIRVVTNLQQSEDGSSSTSSKNYECYSYEFNFSKNTIEKITLEDLKSFVRYLDQINEIPIPPVKVKNLILKGNYAETLSYENCENSKSDYQFFIKLPARKFRCNYSKDDYCDNISYAIFKYSDQLDSYLNQTSAIFLILSLIIQESKGDRKAKSKDINLNDEKTIENIINGDYALSLGLMQIYTKGLVNTRDDIINLFNPDYNIEKGISILNEKIQNFSSKNYVIYPFNKVDGFCEGNISKKLYVSTDGKKYPIKDNLIFQKYQNVYKGIAAGIRGYNGYGCGQIDGMLDVGTIFYVEIIQAIYDALIEEYNKFSNSKKNNDESKQSTQEEDAQQLSGQVEDQGSSEELIDEDELKKQETSESTIKNYYEFDCRGLYVEKKNSNGEKTVQLEPNYLNIAKLHFYIPIGATYEYFKVSESDRICNYSGMGNKLLIEHLRNLKNSKDPNFYYLYMPIRRGRIQSSSNSLIIKFGLTKDGTGDQCDNYAYRKTNECLEQKLINDGTLEIPVYAMIDGKVTISQSGDKYVVNIFDSKDNVKYQVKYEVLSKVFVKDGDSVQMGQIIGAIGNKINTLNVTLYKDDSVIDLKRCFNTICPENLRLIETPNYVPIKDEVMKKYGQEYTTVNEIIPPAVQITQTEEDYSSNVDNYLFKCIGITDLTVFNQHFHVGRENIKRESSYCIYPVKDNVALISYLEENKKEGTLFFPLSRGRLLNRCDNNLLVLNILAGITGDGGAVGFEEIQILAKNLEIPIYAAISGTITLEKRRDIRNNADRYTVVINSRDGYKVTYENLNKIFVENNADVKIGQIIGTLGDAGANLAFSVQKDGKLLNPLKDVKYYNQPLFDFKEGGPFDFVAKVPDLDKWTRGGTPNYQQRCAQLSERLNPQTVTTGNQIQEYVFYCEGLRDKNLLELYRYHFHYDITTLRKEENYCKYSASNIKNLIAEMNKAKINTNDKLFFPIRRGRILNRYNVYGSLTIALGLAADGNNAFAEYHLVGNSLLDVPIYASIDGVVEIDSTNSRRVFIKNDEYVVEYYPVVKLYVSNNQKVSKAEIIGSLALGETNLEFKVMKKGQLLNPLVEVKYINPPVFDFKYAGKYDFIASIQELKNLLFISQLLTIQSSSQSVSQTSQTQTAQTTSSNAYKFNCKGIVNADKLSIFRYHFYLDREMIYKNPQDNQCYYDVAIEKRFLASISSSNKYFFPIRRGRIADYDAPNKKNLVILLGLESDSPNKKIEEVLVNQNELEIPVYAACSGVVSVSGQILEIKCSDTIFRYDRLSRIIVKNGESVSKGQVVGVLGNSISRLIFSVIKNGKEIDPLTLNYINPPETLNKEKYRDYIAKIK
ncbi:MAG: peptidoglycan DD-metalloendopeptidase family protein [Candidatus Woesearchaeota archaeon]